MILNYFELDLEINNIYLDVASVYISGFAIAFIEMAKESYNNSLHYLCFFDSCSADIQIHERTHIFNSQFNTTTSFNSNYNVR